MVTTVKFSQFPNANLGDQSNEPVGLSEGNNVKIPMNIWTTAGRPSTPFNGLLGYNTDLSQYEFWDGGSSSWVQLAAGTGGTVTSITAGAGLSGGVITTFGTIAIADDGVTPAMIAPESGGGIPIQVKLGSLTTPTSIVSVTPISTGVTVTISPSAVTSNVLLMATVYMCLPTTDNGFLQFYNGTNAIGVATSVGSRTACGGSIFGVAVNSVAPITLMWIDSPATVSPVIYTVQAWTSLGNQSYVNRSIGDANSSVIPRTVSTILAMEIK